MKTIWKFQIPLADEFVLNMPMGAQILSAQSQDLSAGDEDWGAAMFLWALVNPDAAPAERKFKLLSTGNPPTICLPVDTYIATVPLNGLVWHLFESGAE